MAQPGVSRARVAHPPDHRHALAGQPVVEGAGRRRPGRGAQASPVESHVDGHAAVPVRLGVADEDDLGVHVAGGQRGVEALHRSLAERRGQEGHAQAPQLGPQPAPGDTDGHGRHGERDR